MHKNILDNEVLKQSWPFSRKGPIFRGHAILAIILFLILLMPFKMSATHNRAGEIKIEQLGPLTLRATIITYTKASSILADRDSLEIVWGDGTSEWVRRSNGNGQGEILPNDIKYNLYIAEHTYPGRATYTLSMMDPNRNGGILNVNPPNSESVPFYIEATYTFLNPQFQGFNNSAILLQPPIDFGCIGQRFIHNPGAYDPDGDSLSYELIIPLQDENSEVPRYSFPNLIAPGPDNMISLDPVTGDFVWDAPQRVGEYNIAFRIYEHRNGRIINSFIRDLQIDIRDCDNQPPVVDALEEICVLAGDTIRIPIKVTDPDMNPRQQVKVEVRGGPFIQEFSPAQVIGDRGFSDSPLEVEFFWATTCEHISPEYYSVTIRGVDDFYDSTGLADLKTIRIKVSGPPPQDLRAEPLRQEINLSWASPYICDMPGDDSFRGFTIWKKIGSAQFQQDTCKPDIASKGYQAIAFAQKDKVGGRYFYTDADVEKGKTYCYRVTAEFSEFSLGGNPYNSEQSLASNEICVQLKRDIPLITHVTVDTTDLNNGQITIRWVPPSADALDTIQNPGPYRYVIERARGINGSNYTQVINATFNNPNFADLRDDTIFIDQGLNTTENGYRYRIAFYAAGQFQMPFGYAEPASSVYLNTTGNDKRINLNWMENVPWENFEYIIFKQNETTGQFDTLGISTSGDFVDREVENGQSYCYKIQSVGSYGLEDLSQQLINFSQIDCAVPVDSSAPCLPTFELSNICDEDAGGGVSNDLENSLSWTFNGIDCAPASDLAGFNIYFTEDPETTPSLLITLSPSERMYFHQPEELFGCYALSTIDTLGNESPLSPLKCAQVCPSYTLPNAFTPNGDGANDLFVPRSNRFVNEVEFIVYNRWGETVFETNDPRILWNGQDMGGNDLPEGTYYYKILLSFVAQPVSGQEINNEQSGYIELIR